MAVCGLAALFALPAAAQAHHIDLVASCDSMSTLRWRVDFASFSSGAKPTTKGTVKLDGSVVQQVPTATISFNTCRAGHAQRLRGGRQGRARHRYVGDQATFVYKVKNVGNVTLTTPVVTDDMCSPVTKVPEPNTNSFDPGDTFTYTCTTTITDAMGNQLVNVGKACGS